MKALLVFMVVYLIAAFVNWDILWPSFSNSANRIGILLYLFMSAMICVPVYWNDEPTKEGDQCSK